MSGSRKPTFEQFAAARRYQPALAFSPDGAELAYSTNTSGQFNLWRQPSDGGYARQVTAFTDEAVREISWSPDGERILFTADHHGNEQYQLHLVKPAGDWPERLPGEPDVQHYAGQWSPDGRAFAYAANDREPTDQDVCIRRGDTGEVTRVFAQEGSHFAGYWSPDSTKLQVVRFNSNTDLDVFVVDVATRQQTEILPEVTDAKLSPGPWAKDGSGFYLLSDHDREFIGLGFHRLATGSVEWVEAPEWDIESVDLSRDGKTLVWSVNEDGFSRHYWKDLESGTSGRIEGLPDGVSANVTLSPAGDRLAVLHVTARRPAEIYVVDLRDGAVRKITDGFLGGIDEAEMVAPELVRIPTFDGRLIPALLYRPRGEGPSGIVLSIHGGPEAQERPGYGYNGLYQYWLSRGIGVLAPNIRGSTGYGKTYQKLIHRDFGGDDLKDFDACVQYLHGLSWVNQRKIGVFGGSYGGFATLSCVSRLPDYWAAAVDIVGPSNLVTFAKAVPPTWRRFMVTWVGDPYTEEAFLMERSPITYVDQINTPLFVIQGANDPRVVKPESDQIVERLRARGVEVRYDVYEDEGHGFTKRTNELKAFRDSAEFLERYLA